MQVAPDARLELMRARLDAACETCGPDGEIVLHSGLEYLPGEPCVLVRRRGGRYDIGDDGAAVRKAGSPQGGSRRRSSTTRAAT